MDQRFHQPSNTGPGWVSADLASLDTVRSRMKKRSAIETVLSCYLSLRSVVSHKTKLTDDSAHMLLNLLYRLMGEAKEEKMAFVRACVGGLEKHRDDRRTLTFLFEQ